MQGKVRGKEGMQGQVRGKEGMQGKDRGRLRRGAWLSKHACIYPIHIHAWQSKPVHAREKSMMSSLS